MVKTGLSAVIGSWKISAISRAADLLHLALGERQQVAALEQRSRPPAIRPGGCTSRMIDSAVTDLPLPDSPTRPSVSPARDVEADVDRPPATSRRRMSKPVVRCSTESSGSSVRASVPRPAHRQTSISLCSPKTVAQRVGDLADASRALRRRAMIGGTRLSPSRAARRDRVERRPPRARRRAPRARRARARPAARSTSGSICRTSMPAASSGREPVDADDDALAGVDRLLRAVGRRPGSRAGCMPASIAASVPPAASIRSSSAARLALDRGWSASSIAYDAAERIDGVGDAGLVRR